MLDNSTNVNLLEQTTGSNKTLLEDADSSMIDAKKMKKLKEK